MKNPFFNLFFKNKSKPEVLENKGGKKNNEPFNRDISSIPPGRVSIPDDGSNLSYTTVLRGLTKMVTPSFRVEVISLIRDLYKVNPDMGIALQDMFKLTNTSHDVTFPNNTDKESDEMRKHLSLASKRWSMYTAGINGLVNKMIVQCLVGGAISIEAVPNNKLDGVSTILFIKPDTIVFERDNEGVYHPYQKNPQAINIDKQYIKLNTDTYVYAGTFNDTDEPYGIPPFMAALDSLRSQQDMKTNFKHIMELMGMVGFLEAKMAKPDRRADESVGNYRIRLENTLRRLKRNLKDGMKDGIVTGYIDDHEFKMNSTTKDLANIKLPWEMNQQSVANGLGVNGSIIGVSGSTEASTGINLSKMISQLKNLQMIISYVLEFIYSLELRLAGFNNKGMRIVWATTTIADDVKIQQARQYKIQNLDLLYKAGIISQEQYAWEMGYDSPAEKEPRVPLDDSGISDPQEVTKKKQRQADKNQSARRTRDKSNPNPSRGDQDTKPR